MTLRKSLLNAAAAGYENEKGVLLKMRSKIEGVAINLGVGRLVLEFLK